MTLAHEPERGMATVQPVRKVAMVDVPALVGTLARAFDADPMVNWLLRQDGGRAAAFQRFFDIALRRMTLPHELVFTTSGLQGAALWTPSGRWKLGLLDQLRLLPSMARSVGYTHVPKVMSGVDALERKHPRVPHYYLFLLGVEPAMQGRGVGSALLVPVLERCDRERMPAYLETATARNVPLYERNGFRVREEFTVPHGGPKSWLMWREPH